MFKIKQKPRTSTRLVSTLVRRIQKIRREQLTDEKIQATSGMYKCAIESHARAEILQSVLNGIQSIQRTNKEVSDAGPLTPELKPKREPGIR